MSDSSSDDGIGLSELMYHVGYQETHDMIKAIGCFTSPMGIETWERYVQRLEKTAEHHHIPEDRWSEILTDMLKGGARRYLDTEIEFLQRNLSYEEILDLLTQIYCEFDVQAWASKELPSQVQLEGEGVAAFTSALKRHFPSVRRSS